MDFGPALALHQKVKGQPGHYSCLPDELKS